MVVQEKLPNEMFQVRTLNNQLVRMISDESTKVKQGALEYNAYLIKNLIKEHSTLTEAERATAMDILYVNLSKLALSTDQCIAKNIERDRLVKKIKLLQEENDESFDNLPGNLEQPLITDGTRLNRIARACNENALEYEDELEA